MRLFNKESALRKEDELQPYRWKRLSITTDTPMLDDGGYGMYGNQAKFGLEVKIRTEFFANQAQYPDALKNARELVNREFFGDVLKHISYARQAIMECDSERAIHALCLLEKEMTG